MKNRFTFFLLLWCAVGANSQNSFQFERILQWSPNARTYTLADGTPFDVWKFDGCVYGDEARSLPIFSERFLLQADAEVNAEITTVQWEAFAKKPSGDDAFLSNELVVQATVEQERAQFFARVKFIPIRKVGNAFERARSFTVNLSVSPKPVPPTPASERNFTYTSVLSSGDVYKFGAAQSGIYKLDYNFLKNELGISNLDNIDPRTIRLYGNGGNMLPERNSDPRPDDLTENAIQVVGEQDGKFNTGDYILFYAQGPRPWRHRPHNTDPELTVQLNLYDLHAWYFIKVGEGFGLRIQEKPSLDATVYTTEEFDDFQRIEEERFNLLYFNPTSQGSGKRWFGDYYYQARQLEYSFNFPNWVQGSTARVKAEFAGRSSVPQSVRLEAPGTTISRNISSVNTANNDANFASVVALSGSFQPGADAFKVRIAYPEVGPQSEGWLDYIEVNARRRLSMVGPIMEFRDLSSMAQPSTTFRLSGASGNVTVWDVSNPQTPFAQQRTQTGSTVTFGANTQGVLLNFVAFTDAASFPKPERTAGKIRNQNLHSLENAELAIVYHPDFQSDVERFAQHRRDFSGLNVITVDINQIFNEFSSGAKDPTAIRDFARMLLTRNPDKFKYLLLFGDASFDPKGNIRSDENKDFVPCFQTAESLSPIESFPADDYYALLSPTESGTLIGALDIAVGRFVCKNASEARAIVDKIIAYDKDPATLGDWRLRAIYVADDEDGNAHINQADKLANENAQAEDWFNIAKIYFDAYQQVATSAGQRFPDAKSAVNSEVFKGALLVNYIGHGGPRGLSQERVIAQSDIAGWDNTHRCPLFITATCTFGGYDDFTTVTGGEQTFLKVNSGAIALFTTVRSVYIAGNEDLTDAVQNFLFKRNNDGTYRTIGDILKDAKNTLTNDIRNARRFTLLGDPSMFLGMPEHRVATTHINGKPVNTGLPDTLKALMPVEIKGVVTDLGGTPMGNFNGRAFVTVFDKEQTLQTLGQDPGSIVRSFKVRRNVIFKGSATVTNGRFTVNFVVPKDINYSFGQGKISYYAENGTPFDAAGADNNIVIGGNAGLVKDDTPPTVQAFLNTDAFVFGGITDNSPKILVKCADDYGMNVTGASLGHDLTAVLDGNVLETIVLNEFYTSTQDDSRKGQAIYPLRNLTVGRHTLRVKGWDIANNSGEGYTEFVVAESGKAALAHVLNYPNPFTTNTYFQFEHNLAGQMLDVQVSIFTVSGRLVKTIQQSVANNDGFRISNEIRWDGNDEYGDPLARGVYLYRVKVRGTDTTGASTTAQSDFEKLVILK